MLIVKAKHIGYFAEGVVAVSDKLFCGSNRMVCVGICDNEEEMV